MRYERSPARPTTPPRHRPTTPGADDTFPERAAARLRTAVVAAAFLGFGSFLYRADVGTLIPDWAWGGPAAPGDQSNSWAGVRLPPARAGDRAGIDGDEEVIGVCVAGRARAYLVRAMLDPMHHVVNDLLGGRPVSVTFCSVTRCARVLTGSPGDSPLDIKIGGWKRGGLALHVGGEDYSQETGESLTAPHARRLPYPELPFRRTTWREWRQAHPDSDVYTGDRHQG